MMDMDQHSSYRTINTMRVPHCAGLNGRAGRPNLECLSQTLGSRRGSGRLGQSRPLSPMAIVDGNFFFFSFSLLKITRCTLPLCQPSFTTYYTFIPGPPSPQRTHEHRRKKTHLPFTMSRMSSVLFSVLAALIAILAAGLLYGDDDTYRLSNSNSGAAWDTIKYNNPLSTSNPHQSNNNQVWEKPPQCRNVSQAFCDAACQFSMDRTACNLVLTLFSSCSWRFVLAVYENSLLG